MSKRQSLLHQSSQQGCYLAHNELGNFYSANGEHRDLEKAKQFYDLAREVGGHKMETKYQNVVALIGEENKGKEAETNPTSHVRTGSVIPTTSPKHFSREELLQSREKRPLRAESRKKRRLAYTDPDSNSR